MKRIIASAGLAAVGAASVQAAYTPGLTPMEQAKPWSVSVAVRGFYDDNIFARPSDSGAKQESFGVSVNPTVGLNFALERTLIQFNYSYDFRWFEGRDENEADHIQLADLAVSHEFSERFKVDVVDKFTYAQEGTVRVGEGAITIPGRSDGDYISNRARGAFTAGVTERLNLEVAYQNDIWDFENSGLNSYSALLDRMEHLGTLELGYAITPATTGGIGYKYQDVGSRSTDRISIPGANVPPAPGTPANTVLADTRDNRSHYVYGGVEHQFNPQLNAALRAGVQLVDFHRADELTALGQGYKDDATIPYIDFLLGYNYNPGSFVNVGVVHTMAATSVGQAQSQDATGVYLDLNHRITPKWTFGTMLLYQYSNLRGGVFDGDKEQLFVAGVSLDYLISQNLSAEVGYNYDLLDSDVRYFGIDSRSYDRNRVYIGLRARF
jgi:predicted porin